MNVYEYSDFVYTYFSYYLHINVIQMSAGFSAYRSPRSSSLLMFISYTQILIFFISAVSQSCAMVQGNPNLRLVLWFLQEEKPTLSLNLTGYIQLSLHPPTTFQTFISTFHSPFLRVPKLPGFVLLLCKALSACRQVSCAHLKFCCLFLYSFLCKE